MQSHQKVLCPEAAKGRSHRRTESIGKAMPVTSLLLHFPPPTVSSLRSTQMHDTSNLVAEIEHPPRLFPVSSNQSSDEQDSDNSKNKAGKCDEESGDEGDVGLDYELLVSECSSDGDGDDGDGHESDPEECVTLIGNSIFYTPCLTCTGFAPADLATRPNAINDMCRHFCTDECRLRLSLAGYVPPTDTALHSAEALRENVANTRHRSYASATTPPQLPPRPPTHVAIQRKKFLTDLLRPHDADTSDEEHMLSATPTDLLAIAAGIVVPTTPDLAVDKVSEEPTEAQSTVDAGELDLFKDFREKSEIAEALAKTSAMTSTSQMKQRLAARKLEIELDNASAIAAETEHEPETAVEVATTLIGEHSHDHDHDHDNDNDNDADNGDYKGIVAVVKGRQGAAAVTDTAAALKHKSPDTVAAAKGKTGSGIGSEFEPPRDLLLYLVRMGSFNSAPKINNIDSQDDDLEIPKGLSAPELLQHVRRLHGEHQPPLLSRYFLKPLPSLATQIVSNDITDGLRCLQLNSVSRAFGAPLSDPKHIRLLQWNLLSQTLGQNNDGFVRCPEEALKWEHRKFLIVQEILQNHPDLICLQEVDHFKFLQNILGTQDYEGIFFPKPDSPCLYIEENNGPDGCAIFYRRNKFELKSFSTRILEVWRVQSNQVAIAANLLVKGTGREVCVCTTHLKARHGSLLSKLRNEQGRDLIRFVKNFAGERGILLCGDFNAEPIEPVYRTILNCDFLNLSSAYADMRYESDECNSEQRDDTIDGCEKVQKSIQAEPPYTTWKIREDGEVCHTIDYVFYAKDHFKVKNCLEFPRDDEIGKDRTPSFQYPSDHFSLVCDFEMIDRKRENQQQQQQQQQQQRQRQPQSQEQMKNKVQ